VGSGLPAAVLAALLTLALIGAILLVLLGAAGLHAGLFAAALLASLSLLALRALLALAALTLFALRFVLLSHNTAAFQKRVAAERAISAPIYRAILVGGRTVCPVSVWRG
jgi:hypothetical protein